MDHRTEANPDTREEVDLLIFDYLLCLTIERVINDGGETSSSGNSDVCWLNNMLETLMKVLALPEVPSVDLRIKAQILQLANILSKPRSQTNSTQEEVPQELPTALSTVATSLISLCDAAEKKKLKTHGARIAVLLSAYTALEEYQFPQNGSSDKLSEYPTEILKAVELRLVGNNPGATRPAMVLHNLRSAILNALMDIMKLLNPPILNQIERGKVGELSRAETHQLREKIGLS
ncbi:hypothetical protein P175DRAFT_0496683 [Aspergillus ochraceoroseus IBT 24754]|uniref:Uncharacterized protein n=1 Tax=Aspergillus ochraceoroseus IBT 24754 TaxID=1392256 RepID=A0A2T5LKX9_9EURO|nr:uncharacterized protein P175DRAFT_0496683 [Aspergillus ochraceoroseus IBT 24754]PTU16925.1 hypothetical protein P175DRAFT_0496683 [Aspergillus ochraceoroseus IBT 24754]